MRIFAIGQEVWLSWEDCIEHCTVVAKLDPIVRLKGDNGGLYAAHWTRVHSGPLEAGDFRRFVRERAPFPPPKEEMNLPAVWR